MFLEIVTPEASIFQGEVESVTVPGTEGEFQMLENHAPIVSLLQEGTVKIRGHFNVGDLLPEGSAKDHAESNIARAFSDLFTDGEEGVKFLAIQSGTVELKDNKIIILVD